MTLTEWTQVTYWEHEIGKYEFNIEYRILELKKKVLNKTITTEEKEELTLLTS